MNDIIKMALVTGFYGPAGAGMDRYSGTAEDLARFAALVRADEREQCAALAQETVCDTHLPTGVKIYGTRVAKAIRSRT